MSARPDLTHQAYDLEAHGKDDDHASVVRLFPPQASLESGLRERANDGVAAMRERLDRTDAALRQASAAIAAGNERLHGLQLQLETAYRQRDDYHNELVALHAHRDKLNRRLVTAYAVAIAAAASLLVTLGLHRRG
jgi:septal ring factor EnvC (AmiA/AmiB activator)